MADGHIILDTRVDTTGVKKGFSAIKNGANSLMGTVGKLGAAIGVAFGVSALVKFAKQAVELSSDVQEVQNVVDVSFGDMRDQMEAFANTAIEKFGISALTAKRTGSTYMAMAKGMGIAGQEAADMALNLTGLSADMASFYNVSQKYADIALKSVFTGETETLKQYGIVMTQTNLQEFARQKGIIKSIQAMTQQEQTMLRYQYVMKQTALAQGDFARTQDSWANQTRILSERWKEMQIVWGDAFRTIGTLILPAINTLIKGLTTVAQYAKSAAQAIARMFGKEIDSSKETSNNISESVDSQNKLTDAVKETTKAANNQLASFDEINTLSKDTAKDTGTGGWSAGISGKDKQDSSVKVKDVKFDTNNLEKQFQKILKKISPLTNAFKSLWEQMKKISKIEFTFLNNLWNRTLKPMGEWLVNSVFAQIVSDIATGLNNSQEPLENFNTVLGNIAAHTFDSLQWLWENILNPMEEWAVTTLLPTVLDTVSAALGFLDEVIEAAKPSFEWIWDNFFVPIRDFIWESIISFLNGLKDAFKNLSDWCRENPETVQYMADIIIGFLAGVWVYNSSKKMISFLTDLIKKFKEFGGLKGMMSSLGTAINSPALAIGALTAAGLFWVKNWDKIKAAFTGMESWQKAIFIILGVAAAVAVLWTAISVGVAAAGILAGLAALGLGAGILAVGKANESKAKETTVKSIPTSASSYVPNKTIGEYSIPGLAKGAVLPANKPFLAQLGDQKNGRNLEAPESLLREIYSEQNQPMIAILLEMLEELKKGHVIKADKREIAKTVREGEKDLGKSFVTGGFANAY